jgi:polyhydroxybutyrate depolymerase
MSRASRLALTVSCFVVALGLVGCGSASAPATTGSAASTGAAASLGSNVSHFTVRTPEGRVRSYIVYAPPGGAKNSPLVLVYHGAEGTAEGTAKETDFVQVAAQKGIVVAFLQGYEDTWNEGAGHTPAEVAGVNDVQFTSAALSQIESRYSIDRTRIAATGFSNGALLTELLGCRLAQRLTLVAPVAGQLPVSVSSTCSPSRPISVLELHGTADRSIPYTGGHFVGVGGGTTVLSAPANAARWASLNGCAKQSNTTDSALATVLTTYSACRDRVVVQLRTLQGAGHGWPSDVGVLIAEFLQEHPGTPAS